MIVSRKSYKDYCIEFKLCSSCGITMPEINYGEPRFKGMTREPGSPLCKPCWDKVLEEIRSQVQVEALQRPGGGDEA